MNMYTNEIVRLAVVNKQDALAIQEQMEINGVDFSECSERGFALAMREAQKDLADASSILERVEPHITF